MTWRHLFTLYLAAFMCLLYLFHSSVPDFSVRRSSSPSSPLVLKLHLAVKPNNYSKLLIISQRGRVWSFFPCWQFGNRVWLFWASGSSWTQKGRAGSTGDYSASCHCKTRRRPHHSSHLLNRWMIHLLICSGVPFKPHSSAVWLWRWRATRYQTVENIFQAFSFFLWLGFSSRSFCFFLSSPLIVHLQLVRRSESHCVWTSHCGQLTVHLLLPPHLHLNGLLKSASSTHLSLFSPSSLCLSLSLLHPTGRRNSRSLVTVSKNLSPAWRTPRLSFAVFFSSDSAIPPPSFLSPPPPPPLSLPVPPALRSGGILHWSENCGDWTSCSVASGDFTLVVMWLRASHLLPPPAVFSRRLALVHRDGGPTTRPSKLDSLPFDLDLTETISHHFFLFFQLVQT